MRFDSEIAVKNAQIHGEFFRACEMRAIFPLQSGKGHCIVLRYVMTLDFAPAKKLIEEHDTITIYGHAMPDGDCYGSQLGLRELIRDNYPDKKVYMIGSGLPGFFERLCPMDVVDDATIASSLAILVDVSCLRRVEDPRVFQAKAFLKFDHHQPNEELEPFDGTAVVDSDRIAASEIIADMAFAYGWKLSVRAAEALYLGICTDSGRFAYRGTTEHTMEVAGRLKNAGARTRSLERIAYYQPPEIIHLKRKIRRRAKSFRDVCYCVLTAKAYQSCGVEASAALRCVNSLNKCFPESHAYALFVFFPGGEINVELRSNKGYPVHGVAKAFGGGGHRYASGLTLDPKVHSVEDVLKALNEVERDEDESLV